MNHRQKMLSKVLNLPANFSFSSEVLIPLETLLQSFLQYILIYKSTRGNSWWRRKYTRKKLQKSQRHGNQHRGNSFFEHLRSKVIREGIKRKFFSAKISIRAYVMNFPNKDLKALRLGSIFAKLRFLKGNAMHVSAYLNFFFRNSFDQKKFDFW